jgi:hypothetical protein
MFDELSAEILASLIKGFPTTRTRTTRTTKQNVDPAVHFVYSRVKITSVLTRVCVKNLQKTAEGLTAGQL